MSLVVVKESSQCKPLVIVVLMVLVEFIVILG